MNNKEKLVYAFTEALGVDEDLIVNSLKYQSIKEWDSVSHMILITELEDIFEISIETDDVIDLSSVEKAKKILSKYSINFD
tara:strand:+ start:214 stop:456 length:243 start_codon:yes stop_codon:yes gene_type:complete